ncbi:transposase [Kitasatospora sp. NPDC093550]|uniref:transposase n=1 Tax=Kitasatospora sp. NPDC093550 TaxID=3364089 RepID=UPI003811E9AD
MAGLRAGTRDVGPAWLVGRGGQPEGYCHQQLVDAVRCLVAGGIAWRAVPADFPAWDRVYAFFRRWRDKGMADEFHDRLRDRVREAAGRDPEPTAGIVDAQSVKGAASVPATSRGFDGGKKVNGRKRHTVVDAERLGDPVDDAGGEAQGALFDVAGGADGHPDVVPGRGTGGDGVVGERFEGVGEVGCGGSAVGAGVHQLAGPSWPGRHELVRLSSLRQEQPQEIPQPGPSPCGPPRPRPGTPRVDVPGTGPPWRQPSPGLRKRVPTAHW